MKNRTILSSCKQKRKKLEGELNAGQSELAKYHKLEKYSVSQSDIQEQSMYHIVRFVGSIGMMGKCG